MPLSWKREHLLIGSIPKQKLMVALAFGQSNSANFGDGSKKAGNGVYNFYQGKLFHAKDPMLGADSNGASVWPRLGDLLISTNHYDNIIFSTIGISGSKISRWQPGGDLHQDLLSAIQSLEANNLTITHLLWHQGESDAKYNTSKNDYQSAFKNMLRSIRDQDVYAPIYVSIASRYKGHPKNETIRNAQIELAQENRGIFTGPDSDQLGEIYRRDGTHFNSAGLDKFAQLWFEKINQPQSLLSNHYGSKLEYK